MVSRMKPILSARAAHAGRCDFLGWMLAAPALAGCSVAAHEDERRAASATEPTAPGAAGAPGVDGVDGVEPDEVLETEENLAACLPTTRDAEGPYFEAGSPRRVLRIAELDEPGVRFLLEGRLRGPDCRTPLRGYTLDVWQADAAGNYYQSATSGYRLRGKVVSDSDGRYRLETVLPGRYGDAAGIRPAHLHAKILTPQGNTLLTTQIYFAGDPYLGQADYCTRSRACSSSDPNRALTLSDAVVSGHAGKRATFNAVTARA
jgi:protocatechuate 3,4-dioxygenase beta subunit